MYKNLVRFRGDHNHPRPSFFYSSVCCFFHQQLRLDQVLLGGNPVGVGFCFEACQGEAWEDAMVLRHVRGTGSTDTPAQAPFVSSPALRTHAYLSHGRVLWCLPQATAAA